MDSTRAKVDNTPCPRGVGQKETEGGQQEKEGGELDKMSHLVLWYGENQKSPMYSLIRQSSPFNAYEEGIAKGVSLVPIKSTLHTTIDGNNDDTLLSAAMTTTVVCGGADGDSEEEETTMTTTVQPVGDGSIESTIIKQKRGFEDFMARSPSSKNKFEALNVVEVALLREDSDAFDVVDDSVYQNNNSVVPALENIGTTTNNTNKNHDSPPACVPIGSFTTTIDDKDHDHDDIEVLWKEEVETSDGGFKETGGDRGEDLIIKEVMDKLLVEVKVEEEWNEPEQEEEQEQLHDKYAFVKPHHQLSAKTQVTDYTKQQQQEPEQQDDTIISDCAMEDYNQEEDQDEEEEEQEDRYAVKTNPSENQENAFSSKENTLDERRDEYNIENTLDETRDEYNVDINYNINEAEIETMEEREEDRKLADEDVSDKAVEEEVIFMSFDSSDEADEQQQQNVAKAEDITLIHAKEQLETCLLTLVQTKEQLATCLDSSSNKTPPINCNEHDPEIVIFSSQDNSAAADEEVAAIVDPDQDAENKTSVKKASEKNDVEEKNTAHKLSLRSPMGMKMDQVSQVVKDSKIMESGSNSGVAVTQGISPPRRPIEMQAAKGPALTNKVKCTLDEAMEHRDVWYDMSLTSRDESILQEDALSTSAVPPPLSPRTDSDMTGSKDSSSDLSFTNLDGDSVNEGPFQIIIEGAGTQVVNGVYYQDGYYDSACRYSKKGHWKGGPCTFYLCQCIIHDGTRSWFISLVPDGCPVVTGYFYSAPVTKACRHIPPLKGWDKAVHGQKPRPTLSYRSKLAEENIKLTAEREALEQQNKTLSRELSELNATFTQQNETWSKEKETWEQQQKNYENDLSKKRDEVEQNLKDIASLRATVVDCDCKEKKLKDDIAYLRSAVKAHELQLKLVLHNQSLQLEMAQYERKDPEELMAHTKALEEKVAQYKQKEQRQQQQSLQSEVAQYERKDPEELKVHTKTLQVKVAQYKKKKQQQQQSLQLEVAQYERKDPEELKVHTEAPQEKAAQYKQKEQQQQQQQMKTDNIAMNAATSVKQSSSPSSKQVTVQKEAVVATGTVKNTLCLPHPLI